MKLFLQRLTPKLNGQKDWIRCYGMTKEDTPYGLKGTLYGPFCLRMSKLHISKNSMSFYKAQAVIQGISKGLDKNQCETPPYGKVFKGRPPSAYVVWAHAFTQPEVDFMWQNYLYDFGEPKTTSDRVSARAEFPYHPLQIRKDLAQILSDQIRLHENLRALRKTYIVPLLAAGVLLEDSMRWLWQEEKDRAKLTSRLTADAEKRAESYEAVPDENFYKDTSEDMRRVNEQADDIEARLQGIHPENFLQRSWLSHTEHHNSANPFGSIIYLKEPRGIRNARRLLH